MRYLAASASLVSPSPSATSTSAQLPPDLQAAMLGTVGTIVSFQIGPDDSDRLAKTFHLKPDELTALEPYTAYVTTGAKTTMIRMEPPPTLQYPTAPAAIRRHCRGQLSVPREHVERRIATFIKNTAPKEKKKRPTIPIFIEICLDKISARAFPIKKED